MSWVRLIGNVLVWISGIEALAFVVLYWITSPWWRTPAGRSIMGLLGVLAGILLLSMLRQVVGGDTLWFAWLRVAVFACLPIEIARRTLLLIRLQLRSRRARGERDEAGSPR
jgi:xanthosine utilization system XapX-like protein